MTAPRSRRRLVAVGALLALGAVGGCTDGAPATERRDADDPAPAAGAADLTEQQAAAGLAALYAGSGSRRTGGVTEQTRAEADCFGRVLAAAVPASALADGGLVVDGAVVEAAPRLPEGLARQWFAAQQACADFVDVSTRAQAAATKGRLDQEAYAACLRGTLDAAAIEEAVVATLTGAWDDPAVERLSDAQTTCARAAVPPD